MKWHKIITIFLVLATTLPFFLFINQIDYSLLEFGEELFYNNLTTVFASIFGFIGAVLIMWENILGNRFFMKFFHPDNVWFNKFHQWIGKYGVLLILIHPILSMYVYGESLLWIFLPDLSTQFDIQLSYGRFAFLILILVYITSVFIREQIKYRPWLYLHYLSYPLLFLTFLHAIDLGQFLDSIPILKIAWLTLFGIFGVLFLYRLVTYAGVLSSRYKITAMEKFRDSAYILTVEPLTKKLIPVPGQYFYMQFKPFGEAHPFSVADFNPETGTLKFGIKLFGKFTKKLENLGVGSELLLDGPYGVFTKEAQNKHAKVILAGGIGITPFVYLLKHFSNAATYLFYSNPYLKDAMFRQEIRALLGKQYYDFISREQVMGENEVAGYLTKESLQRILGDDFVKYNYFICGSKRYIQGMEQTLRAAKVPEEQVFSEKFY